MKTKLFLSAILLTAFNLAAQTSTSFEFKKYKRIQLNEVEAKWNTSLTNLEAPNPDGDSYKDYLEKIKKQQEPKSIHLPVNSRSTSDSTKDSMEVESEFEGNIGGGRPNDLTLAISNDGKIMSCMNANIYIFDEDGNEITNLSLVDFADSLDLPETRMFDPKVIYHPVWDRFVFCFLHSSTAENNRIVFAFSETNDPSEGWSSYVIPGHHLDTTWWSDYPALGITTDEVYLTLNYIQEGVSWQEGFRGSIIWQMDLEDGFEGNNLTAKLWEDITYNGDLVRNLHPVSGGSQPYGPNMYFLSNKNFSLSSDTIFLVELTGKQNDASAEIIVKSLKASQPYGVPPNAYQPYQQYSGEWHRFSTNDSRVLGAFLENDKIQFVGNCLNFTDSTATFYHGFIEGMGQAAEADIICNLNILEDTVEYGYPNIAFAGIGRANDAVISFMHSSKRVYSGFSSIFYKDDWYYTPRTTVKKGYNYVNLISGSSERWGDYSGIQLKYNEPGVIWANGSFGKELEGTLGTNKVNGTWIAKLSSPDTIINNTKQEMAANATLETYPNPFINEISIEFELKATVMGSIQLFNQNGQFVKTLYQDKIKAGKNRLSFSDFHLADGFYVLKVKADDQVLFSKTLVKQ